MNLTFFRDFTLSLKSTMGIHEFFFILKCSGKSEIFNFNRQKILTLLLSRNCTELMCTTGFVRHRSLCCLLHKIKHKHFFNFTNFVFMKFCSPSYLKDTYNFFRWSNVLVSRSWLSVNLLYLANRFKNPIKLALFTIFSCISSRNLFILLKLLENYPLQ